MSGGNRRHYRRQHGRWPRVAVHRFGNRSRELRCCVHAAVLRSTQSYMEGRRRRLPARTAVVSSATLDGSVTLSVMRGVAVLRCGLPPRTARPACWRGSLSAGGIPHAMSGGW